MQKDIPTSYLLEDTNFSYIVIFYVQTLNKKVSKRIAFQDPCQKNLKQLPSSPCCFWTCNVPTIHYSLPPAKFGAMYQSTWHHIPQAEVVSIFCLVIIRVDNKLEQLLFISVPLAFRPLCCVKQTDCQSSLPAVSLLLLARTRHYPVLTLLGATDLDHEDGHSQFRIVGSIVHCRTVQKPPGRINN